MELWQIPPAVMVAGWMCGMTNAALCETIESWHDSKASTVIGITCVVLMFGGMAVCLLALLL